MPRPKLTDAIHLRGVRHNNLKGFDLEVPLQRLVVITGLSGSGKSSLAFDTLYAEGQRRYIETFSPYARQFFDRMDKPRVDSIENIPPAIAIEQRNTVRSTRSTVGTMTEICDHMKVLWPHIASLHCRQCGQLVRREPPPWIWLSLNAEPQMENAECLVTFDLPLSDRLSPNESIALISKQGYSRVLLKGQVIQLDHPTVHSAFRPPHSSLTVVQDRLRLGPARRSRFIEACEQAYHFGKGKLAIHINAPTRSASQATRDIAQDSMSPPPGLKPLRFSNKLHCAKCDLDYRDPSPALFSFNHPIGACPTCKGFGRIITIDYSLAIPDPRRTLREGAVKPWQTGMSADCQRDLLKFCRATGVPIDIPFQELSKDHQDWILFGDPDYGSDEDHEWPRAWYGVKGYFRWLESKAYKMHVRVLLSRYRAYTPCPDCRGARLNPDALLYRLAVPDDGRLHMFLPEQSAFACTASHSQLSLAGFYALPINKSFDLISRLTSQISKAQSVFPRTSSGLEHALQEVHARLQYLNEIGLDYLTLDRPTRTLSGGETERVNLAACLGTHLVHTLFVLDEPSVGLHPRDTQRLVRLLTALRNEGNTVVVVEHESSVMMAADQLIDLGPGHGATGGELVFQGTASQIRKSTTSLTGKYLSGRRNIQIPNRRPVKRLRAKGQRPDGDRDGTSTRVVSAAPARTSVFGLRTSNVPWLCLRNAHRHNLKHLDLQIPLDRFVAVSGVSGSGKSTLIREVLLPVLQQHLGATLDPGKASDRMDQDESQSTPSPSNRPRQVTHVTGFEHLSNVVLVDQSILGKTPRSNPAVYIGAFDPIRELFAQSEAARQQGLSASAFSFNSTQGQCERCRGAGFEKVEMQFLSDVFIRCPDCNGRRYRDHILQVRIQNSKFTAQEGDSIQRDRPSAAHLRSRDAQQAPRTCSIADLLEATVDEAVEFLGHFPDSEPARRAVTRLALLQEVGLGYLELGQPINTLSGGESQRLKLVRHLAESRTTVDDGRKGPPTESGDRHSHPRRRCLFLLDEPTTGLHFEDVRVLLTALQRLVDDGHSLIVIEHNLDVLKCADWIIDLGPEAGEAGGQLVVDGTPETVAACKSSHTGGFLRAVLKMQRGAARQGAEKPDKCPGGAGGNRP